jgi:hypothetical protein
MLALNTTGTHTSLRFHTCYYYLVEMNHIRKLLVMEILRSHNSAIFSVFFGCWVVPTLLVRYSVKYIFVILCVSMDSGKY